MNITILSTLEAVEVIRTLENAVTSPVMATVSLK